MKGGNTLIAPITGDVPATLAKVPAPIEFASFWRRWGAYFVDSMVLAVADFFIRIALGISSPVVPLSSLSGGAIDLAGWWEATSALIRLAVPALYFIWAYSSGGQTIGKAALGIKVVSIDGSPLSWRKGILRTVGYVPSTLMFGLGILMVSLGCR